jgi:hypothetical protein
LHLVTSFFYDFIIPFPFPQGLFRFTWGNFFAILKAVKGVNENEKKSYAGDLLGSDGFAVYVLLVGAKGAPVPEYGFSGKGESLYF